MPLTDSVEVFTRVKDASSTKLVDWIQMSVTDALRSGEHQFRCIECHEKVKLHQDRKGKMASHPEHIKRNPKCSLSDPLP
jgi:hypothetical protein